MQRPGDVTPLPRAVYPPVPSRGWNAGSLQVGI